MTRFTLKTPRAGDHAPSTPTHMSAVHDPRLDRIWDLQQACSALRMGLPLLEERIELLRAVVAEGAVFGPGNTCFDVSLAQHQYDLGVALYERFVHVHEINNLVEAETHLRLALPTWPFGSSSVEPCSVLGSVLRELAFETSNRSLSEEALALHRQPFLVKSDIPALEGACHCRELGLTLRVNYLVNLDQEQYLLESIQHLEAAEAQFAAMAITDHACSAGLILARTDLHTAHMDKARLTENSIISDLALAQCGPDHRDFYQVLWSATMVHRAAAWFCDDAAPLFGTIDVLRDVLADSPSGWVTVFTCELVQALRFRFVREGGEEDLSEAITRVTRLLEGSSADAPQWDKLQGCLADVLYLRFRMNGAASDIENAVRAAELALSRTGIGTGAYYLRLCRFALCREAQYRAFGDIAHLNEGVELHGQVVSLAPSSSGARLVAEQNLLAALGLRAGATASLDDLNRAIELVPHSTTSLVFDHAEAATLLHEIGKVFLMRFEMTASLDDLENATTWHRAAVQRCEITSPHIYDHHNVINAYSTVLRIRFQVLGETDSIAMALKQQKQLANALPVAHAGRTAVLCVLAQILICADPAQDEVAEALNHLQDALNNDYCPAYSRLKDVGNVLMYFTEEHVPHLSSENALTLSTVYSKAIALLPHVASFGLEQRTRLAVIANSGRLTTQAASRAISVGQHELALEMLEAGRSVFWTQGLHLRAPFVDLPVEIGGRLTKITAALGQPMPVSAAAGPAKERELARRRRLGDEFVVVLDEARRLPGFEDLLQNTSFASLAQAARQNPIVVLVAGENVGHAIIILENAQVVLVALEKVNNAPLKALSHSIEMHSRNVRSRGIRKVQATEAHGSSDMYRELWTLIMAPIVNALGWPVSRTSHGLRRVLTSSRKHKVEAVVGWFCVLLESSCNCRFMLPASTRVMVKCAVPTTSLPPTFHRSVPSFMHSSRSSQFAASTQIR
jgi:hypothetical protein